MPRNPVPSGAGQRMFDRFIRLAKATKALREERFEDALLLAQDPLIAKDRRADEVRTKARHALAERAQRRLADGDLPAAQGLLARLAAAGPSAEQAAVAAAVAASVADRTAAADRERDVLAEFRRLLAAGACDAAAVAIAALGPAVRDPLAAQLAERRARATEQFAAAEAAVRAGSCHAAQELLAKAEVLDRDSPVATAVRAKVGKASATQQLASLRKSLESGDAVAAGAALRVALANVPTLGDSEAAEPFRREVAAAFGKALRATDDLGLAVALALDCPDETLALPARDRALVTALQQFAATDAEGGAADAVRLAAADAGADRLATAAAARLSAGRTQAERLAAIRALLSQGQLDTARARLGEFLTEDPMHEGARRDLALVDTGIADLEQRLDRVRIAAREGRLRAACAAALALGGSARIVAEAQQVAADARARMALVDRGLGEVKVALHTRGAAGAEGVRHCLARLQQLAKVQVDHEELPAVIAAVEAEIAALAACEAVAGDLDQQVVGPVPARLADLLGMRSRLLGPDRLDARLCALGDRIANLADLAVEEGRLGPLDAHLAALDGLGVVRADFPRTAERLRHLADARRTEVSARLARAAAALANRDLAEAERLAEEAAGFWREAPELRALREQLGAVRAQVTALDHAEQMVRERDYLGAERKLAGMPPTQALMRTRIYDMKKDLAKAQGLEGAFLLRVDEGGEHLVVRGETVSVGNVRQNRADLPILANLAGRHASIRRSMSFHGGMQDSVVAEEGEVRIGGRVVRQHTLGAGDRVDLGSTFGFVYQVPSSRSLSARLTLQSGFQIAGTDRILLMKDRGRDGRLLLGAAADAHVRVARATAEVEIFATSSGHMRVACEAGGTIDGAPFRGEHPLSAGQLVEAGGISFVLQPWRPGV